jgi:hypothetical protein
MPASARHITPDGERARHWQVLIAVPPAGFGGQLALMRAWLDHNCGPQGWASGPAGFRGIANDAVAFYFNDRALAHAFVERFSCGYRAQS